MATTKARTVTVPIPSLDSADALINAAVETLEASGFVAQSVEIQTETDPVGNQRRIALIHLVHEHFVPGGVLFPVSAEDRYGIGYVRFSGVTADGETVTINGRVYEFDTGGAVAPGSVLVDISGGNSATQSATALAAAITGDGGAVVDALVDTAGTVVLLVGKSAVTAFTLAETLGNGVVSGATMPGGVAAADRYLAAGEYTVTAADVLTWAAGGEVPVLCMDDPGIAPTQHTMQWVDSTGGFGSNLGLTARVARVNANNYAVLVSDPLAVLSATDVIRSSMLA